MPAEPLVAGVDRPGSPQPNLLDSVGGDRFSPIFWLSTLVIGIATGLASGLLMRLLRAVQHLAWAYDSGSFLDAVQHTTSAHRIVLLAATGGLIALSLPVFAALPSRRPGELEAAIWFLDGRMPVIRTIGKAVFSIIVVGLGASLGRESAPKQAGALIGGHLANFVGLNPSQRRLLAACGAGAGIAAVYNVPFGGALFAMEVLLGSLDLALVAPAFLASLAGTVSAWLLLPNEPTYQLPAMSLTPGLIVFALVFGPLAGVASALFIKLIAATATLKQRGWPATFTAIAIFSVLGIAAVPYPALLGNGKNIVELAALGQLAFPMLAALVFFKPLSTAACLVAGAPGGLFTPSLAFGALFGGVCGFCWEAAWPSGAGGAFALIGAGAVLAATTKGPISALVLLMELTHHVDGLIVPLLLAIAGALVVANALDPRSTYTDRIRVAPLTAGPMAVTTATRISAIARLLLTGSDALVVVEIDGERRGTIGAADLSAALPRLYPHAIATARDVIECKQGATLT